MFFIGGEILKEEINIKEILRSIVQLDNSNVTCMCKVLARFNSFPHFMDKVLIKVTEIQENKKFIYAYLMRII